MAKFIGQQWEDVKGNAKWDGFKLVIETMAGLLFGGGSTALLLWAKAVPLGWALAVGVAVGLMIGFILGRRLSPKAKPLETAAPSGPGFAKYEAEAFATAEHDLRTLLVVVLKSGAGYCEIIDTNPKYAPFVRTKSMDFAHPDQPEIAGRFVSALRLGEFRNYFSVRGFTEYLLTPLGNGVAAGLAREQEMIDAHTAMIASRTNPNKDPAGPAGDNIYEQLRISLGLPVEEPKNPSPAAIPSRPKP